MMKQRQWMQQLDWVQWHEALVVLIVITTTAATQLSLTVGATLSLAGWLLRVWVKGFPASPQTFAVRGPYRWVRHPYYLGTFLVFLGLCVASRSWPALAVMLVGMVPIFLKIFAEEERLKDRLESLHYREYRACVPSFLPTIWPYPAQKDVNWAFSWRQAFMKNQRRELDTVLALVVGYGALYGLSGIGQLAWLRWLLAAAVLGVMVVQTHAKMRLSSFRS